MPSFRSHHWSIQPSIWSSVMLSRFSLEVLPYTCLQVYLNLTWFFFPQLCNIIDLFFLSLSCSASVGVTQRTANNVLGVDIFAAPLLLHKNQLWPSTSSTENYENSGKALRKEMCWVQIRANCTGSIFCLVRDGRKPKSSFALRSICGLSHSTSLRLLRWK